MMAVHNLCLPHQPVWSLTACRAQQLHLLSAACAASRSSLACLTLARMPSSSTSAREAASCSQLACSAASSSFLLFQLLVSLTRLQVTVEVCWAPLDSKRHKRHTGQPQNAWAPQSHEQCRAHALMH